MDTRQEMSASNHHVSGSMVTHPPSTMQLKRGKRLLDLRIVSEAVMPSFHRATPMSRKLGSSNTVAERGAGLITLGNQARLAFRARALSMPTSSPWVGAARWKHS